MEHREVTLMEVLRFREKKAMLQERMSDCIPDGTVVSLGMNIPGPVKSGPSIYQAFLEGKKELEWLLQEGNGSIQDRIVIEETAGYAAIYLVNGETPMKIKEKTVALEEQHPLGRIFDIDVLDAQKQSLSRQMVGAARRKCLLCGCGAKECGRNRTHSVSELQAKVFEMIEDWKAGQML